MKYKFLLLLIVLITFQNVSAFNLFGEEKYTCDSQNAVETITWEPIDKVWIYQPAAGVTNAEIRFFITYKSNLNEYEVRRVNATVWYTTLPYHSRQFQMYLQGGI